MLKIKEQRESEIPGNLLHGALSGRAVARIILCDATASRLWLLLSLKICAHVTPGAETGIILRAG